MSDNPLVWQKCTNGEVKKAPLSTFKGKFILVPQFPTLEDWEKAAAIQQDELKCVARSRHKEPEKISHKEKQHVSTFVDVPAPGRSVKMFAEIENNIFLDTYTNLYIDDNAKSYKRIE